MRLLSSGLIQKAGNLNFFFPPKFLGSPNSVSLFTEIFSHAFQGLVGLGFIKGRKVKIV